MTQTEQLRSPYIRKRIVIILKHLCDTVLCAHGANEYMSSTRNQHRKVIYMSDTNKYEGAGAVVTSLGEASTGALIGTAVGAALGAVAGAATKSVTKDKSKGALVGVGVAATGAVLGQAAGFVKGVLDARKAKGQYESLVDKNQELKTDLKIESRFADAVTSSRRPGPREL